MSALDTLSVTANVFQVIGFADTVFHAGKALYELFDKARSAARNITLLLLELQALLSVVAYVHVVIQEHAASPFAQDDGHTLPNVHTILTLIQQDFLHLRGLLEQAVYSRRESWLSIIQSNVRWALKDCDIAAARHRLARYTQNLNAALSVSGRRNDIVLRDDPNILLNSHSYPKVNIFEQEDRTLVIDTGNYDLDQITKSALLLRDPLINSLSRMRTMAAIGINKPQLEHLLTIFDLLIASAHTASAEAIAKKHGSIASVEPLDRRSTASRSKDLTIRRKDKEFTEIPKKYFPMFLEEKTMKLGTIVGSVDAKLLSARSIIESKIIGFKLSYHGNAKLKLSPFSVQLFSSQPGVEYRSDLGTGGLPGLVESFSPASTHQIQKATQLASDVSQIIQWYLDPSPP
ncbi:hypothetical protein N0V83_008764 [Neocucurbitaria cava]|uniref:Fungal N-terminal domain-containing protein n=1 Tax=Neocucurbitaria cava TaxID=798079 RepID=A0A9W9CI93_9PLEO|nr:hypothetical protein N0V83_008764 [Neocucurbitaria cava]